MLVWSLTLYLIDEPMALLYSNLHHYTDITPVLQALHSNVFAVREKGCIFLRFHVTALNAVTDRIKKYILKQISSIMKADFHPGSR